MVFVYNHENTIAEVNLTSKYELGVTLQTKLISRTKYQGIIIPKNALAKSFMTKDIAGVI